jgi:glycosyltransferase involved in cell wall biosynthesis
MGSGNDSAIVSVVLCTYKQPHYLTGALTSLVDQTLPEDRYEVIVVDNGCDDDVRLLADEYAKRANVIHVAEPKLGLSTARNTGVRNASGEYIAFIDDDGVATPSWLERIARAFAAGDSRVGCVGGPIELIWEYPRPDWLADSLLPVLTSLDLGNDARDLADGQWLFGCNMAFKASALHEVGGFSTGLGRVGKNLLSNEEVLLQLMLGRHGFRRFYDPSALVRHHVSPDRLKPEWFLRRFYWQGVSQAVTARLSDDMGLLERFRNAALDAALLVGAPSQLRALASIAFNRDQTERLAVRCATLARTGLVRGWLTRSVTTHVPLAPADDS